MNSAAAERSSLKESETEIMRNYLLQSSSMMRQLPLERLQGSSRITFIGWVFTC